MFQTEINRAAALSHGQRRDQGTAIRTESLRLNRGLRAMEFEEHPDVLELDSRVKRSEALRTDHLTRLVDNFDIERLAPSTCNLRSRVLMQDGKVTGLASLAQETQPACGQVVMQEAA